jgi:hypothetical protein
MLCQTCESIFQGNRQRKLPHEREISSTVLFQKPSNEEATRGKHHHSLAAIEASANSGCHLCTILCDSKPFRLARCRMNTQNDQQLSYEYVRPTALEENHLGLIELHFIFGDSRIAGRGAVVLVPSKSKRDFFS